MSKNEVVVTLNLADVLPVIEAAQEEIDELRSKASQRGARMQIMMEFMGKRASYLHNTMRNHFLAVHPEAEEWFHDNGVPK